MLDRFLDELRQTERRWVYLYTDDNRLRLYPTGQNKRRALCPLTAVYASLLTSKSWRIAALAGKIDLDLAARITDAADHSSDGIDPENDHLRRQLIEACSPIIGIWQSSGPNPGLQPFERVA